MIISPQKVVSPTNQISSLLAQFASGEASGASLCLDYTLELDYLEVPVSVELTALYQASRQEDGSIRLLAAVTDQVNPLHQLLDGTSVEFSELCAQLELSILDLTAPLLLETVAVAKPWGREIWYTGCETRGVSSIQGVPLPWVISLYPGGITGPADGTPLLLKILDPLPDPVYGDLYYEMHTQKKEVYIVTHVDRDAWPDGRGQIRYGFAPAIRARFQNDQEFKSAYLASVQRYEIVRRKIDERFDEFRLQEGYATDEPIPPATLSTWQARLPQQWQHQEAAMREEMHSFTGVRLLADGDVISIPPYTPRALQHGVRAVEFQTPHYERQILSFAQKVLTQNQWDTRSALAEARIDNEPPATLDIVYAANGVVVESIARFDRFTALRITLESACTYQPELDTYFLLMAVNGCCDCGNLQLAEEQACLVPVMSLDRIISNTSTEAIQCLLAYPTR